MDKKFAIVLFCLPILFLGIWGLILSFQMNSGIEVRLPIMGYDPRDLLSGHYIQYQIDWENVNDLLEKYRKESMLFLENAIKN